MATRVKREGDRDGGIEWSAVPFLPARPTMRSLVQAAAGCRGCPLYTKATQTVFGEGPRSARAILVGEQPGHEEDLAGHPFVGPSGRVLNEALGAAGIDRKAVYVTNVVKHFKWTPKGTRRMHQKPAAREIAACMPWLEEEVELMKPEVLICLGATAAQAILGRGFRVSRERGRVLATRLSERTLATVHPSSILRQRSSEDRHREMERFVQDLKVAAPWIAGRKGRRG
jgi:DNA polymerase